MFHIAKHDVQMILYKALVLHFVQNNAQTLEKKILQARILENNTNYKKGKNVKTVTFLHFLEHSILINLRKKAKISCRYHWFAREMTRNERRNSILMTCHYPDLNSVSQWLVVLCGKFVSTNLKNYSYVGSGTSTVWIFWARFSDVISRGNQSRRLEISTVYSSYMLAIQWTFHSLLITGSEILAQIGWASLGL